MTLQSLLQAKSNNFVASSLEKNPCPAPSSAKPEPFLSFCAYGGSVEETRMKVPGEQRSQCLAEVFVMGWSPGTVQHLGSTEVFSFAEQQTVWVWFLFFFFHFQSSSLDFL